MPSHRYTTTGCGTELVVPPMSESRRQHIHGKLRSLSEDARAIGEPPWWVGALVVAFFALAMAGAWWFVAEAFHG
jgi:hypothetical protein